MNLFLNMVMISAVHELKLGIPFDNNTRIEVDNYGRNAELCENV